MLIHQPRVLFVCLSTLLIVLAHGGHSRSSARPSYPNDQQYGTSRDNVEDRADTSYGPQQVRPLPQTQSQDQSGDPPPYRKESSWPTPRPGKHLPPPMTGNPGSVTKKPVQLSTKIAYAPPATTEPTDSNFLRNWTKDVGWHTLVFVGLGMLSVIFVLTFAAYHCCRNPSLLSLRRKGSDDVSDAVRRERNARLMEDFDVSFTSSQRRAMLGQDITSTSSETSVDEKKKDEKAKISSAKESKVKEGVGEEQPVSPAESRNVVKGASKKESKREEAQKDEGLLIKGSEVLA